jgi:hypothetical protein
MVLEQYQTFFECSKHKKLLYGKIGRVFVVNEYFVLLGKVGLCFLHVSDMFDTVHVNFALVHKNHLYNKPTNDASFSRHWKYLPLF